MTPLCAVAGIATFGSAYLMLAAGGSGSGGATRAFAIVSAAFALTTLLAAHAMRAVPSGRERLRAAGSAPA
jgi:hypothetical protein